MSRIKVENLRHPSASTDSLSLAADGTVTFPSGGGGLIPSGAVFYFAASTAPTGYLKANGAAISRTTYAALFAAIGTTFGSGDGSTTFNLPDLRGEFIRGWDDGRGIDTSRAMGSAQSGMVGPHNHTASVTDPGHAHGYSGWAYRASLTDDGPDQLDVYNPTGATTGSHSTGVSVTVNNSSGTETRPRNVALLACIKY